MSIIHYFINTNSSRGFAAFFDSNFAGLKKVIRLNAYPADLRQGLFESVLARAEENGIDAEVIHQCIDNSLEGVILPKLSAGIVNIPPYSNTEYNILSVLNDKNIAGMNQSLKDAYADFAQALKTHDKWEKIYIDNMDFAAADALTEATIEKLIGSRTIVKEAREVHRFFGAATVNGSVDHIDNITAEIEKRYFLKGRPGTGKSTFLRKISQFAQKKGFDTEVYHCAFDPNSLDLVAIRELGLCLFDSTSPHEYFPSRPNDEIIDIYKTAVKPDTDEAYQEEISAVSKEYKSIIMSATANLKRAKESWSLYELEHLSSFDLDLLNKRKDDIISQLF